MESIENTEDLTLSREPMLQASRRSYRPTRKGDRARNCSRATSLMVVPTRRNISIDWLIQSKLILLDVISSRPSSVHLSKRLLAPASRCRI